MTAAAMVKTEPLRDRRGGAYLVMSVGVGVDIRRLETPDEKREVSRRILADLGEWSGIPEAMESYIGRSAALPFWAAFDGGFIAILKHFDKAAEIYVMGVLTAYHRRGIGRLLVDEAEKESRDLSRGRFNSKFAESKNMRTMDAEGAGPRQSPFQG